MVKITYVSGTYRIREDEHYYKYYPMDSMSCVGLVLVHNNNSDAKKHCEDYLESLCEDYEELIDYEVETIDLKTGFRSL